MSQDTRQGVLITQDEIDTALAAYRPPGPDTGGDEATPLFLNESDIVATGSGMDSEDSGYFGLLSQDDIEALLHGDLEGGGPGKAQDEIDSLVHTAAEHATSPAVASDKRGTAQEDVEALFQEAAGGFDKTDGAAAPADGPVVAQDDIDRLLMSALDEMGEDTFSETSGEEAGEVVGQDYIDRLLAGGSDEASPETADAASEGMISQDDINRLLADVSDGDGADDAIDFNEPDAGVEAESESLISQADLDRLIAGEEGDLESIGALDHGDTMPSGEHISQDDINRLLKESFQEAEAPSDDAPAEALEESGVEEPEPEPVILAADEEPPAPPVSDIAPKPGKVSWRRSFRIPGKPLVWTAAAGIVVLITIPLLMMTGKAPPPAPEPEVLTFTIPPMDAQDTDAVGAPNKSIHFQGFMVLVPDDAAAATYVAADLTLEVSDAATVAVIKENEPVVRDIIYGAISEELKTQDISAIDEAGLELAIRKALDRIVSRGAIDRIAFDSLSLV